MLGHDGRRFSSVLDGPATVSFVASPPRVVTEGGMARPAGGEPMGDTGCNDKPVSSPWSCGHQLKVHTLDNRLLLVYKDPRRGVSTRGAR